MDSTTLSAREKRHLILVRHSAPEIVPHLPASQWHLSDEGRLLCQKLAEKLVAYRPAVIVTSLETKAVETGQIVANILDIPIESAPGLHEHERPKVEFAGTKEQFRAQVASLFEHPSQRVFGSETADEAHSRFSAAIANVIEQHPTENLAVVSHGTVITLLVTRAAGLPPIPFWQRLDLPAFVVVSIPDLSLLNVVNSVV